MSIASWLADVPTENVDPNTILPSTTKRKFADIETSTAKRARLRKPLHEDRMNARPRPSTPPEMQQRNSSQSNPGRQTLSEYVFDTPRASEHGMSLRRSSPSRSSASQRSSASSTRSNSPAKLVTLAEMDKPVTFKVWQRMGRAVERPPQQVEEMLSAVHNYRNEGGILAVEAFQEIKGWYAAGDMKKPDFDDSGARAKLGAAPSPQEVDSVVEDAIAAESRLFSEAAWNCESHSPIAKLAWRLSAYKTETEWNNLTVANISPPHLLPSIASGATSGAQRIDFGITAKATPTLHRAFRHLPGGGRRHFHTFNPTDCETIAHELLCVLIETKRANSARSKHLFQLATWSYALFERLEELLQASSSSAQLPLIPLLSIEGPSWKFSVATRDRASGETTVWSMSSPFAQVTEPRQVFVVFAVLQYLFRWAVETYRPWVEQNCIPRSAL